MSQNPIKFFYVTEEPTNPETFSIYFLKSEERNALIIYNSDLGEPLTITSQVDVENFFTKDFKAIGDTAEEAREAIYALGHGEAFFDSFSSQITYYPTDSLTIALETLPTGKYLISYTQTVTTPKSQTVGFFYLEVKKSSFNETQENHLLEATDLATAERFIKVKNIDNTWSSWKRTLNFGENVENANKLTVGRNITIGRTSITFDGSEDLSWSINDILPTGTSGQVIRHDGNNWVAGADTNTTYSAMTSAEVTAGTGGTARIISPALLKTAVGTYNAASATKLATARTINGVSFDGTANISIADATKLPLTGGTLTGVLNLVTVTEAAVSLGTSSVLDLQAGSVFSKTVTATTTFSLTNKPASGRVCSFILEITNGGNYTVNWWSGIKWPKATPPVLTQNGTDAFGFYTTDGGTTWKVLGSQLG